MSGLDICLFINELSSMWPYSYYQVAENMKEM